MYFILKKLVDYYFKDDYARYSTYKNMHYKFFELYKALIFHDLKYISQDNMRYIEENYPDYCFVMFDIYNKFLKIIERINNEVNSQNTCKVKCTIPNLEISLHITKSNDKFGTFIEFQKREIKSIISSVEKIYLDGFISFNDIDKYIISQAEELGKEVIFITRDIHSDFNKDFLKQTVYECDNGTEFIMLNKNTLSVSPDIRYIRSNFYEPQKDDLALPLMNKHKNIKFITPFMNRYDEIKYITSQIGNLVKDKCINLDLKSVKDFI